ncbi:MAG: leucyl aminopeptidase family protein [Rhizobiales bacterium]|nr:leucyl aminopeptidase family protein [Hyphomicrobiales bacterium]MBI3672102.1 leucyl aminopeptidase family protein [Hyphomicrobiales bacterium]
MTPDKILLPAAGAAKAIAITGVSRAGWESCKASLAAASRRWAEAYGFSAEPGRILVIPDGKGAVDRALWGNDDRKGADPFAPGRLARLLPPGRYAFGEGFADPRLAALGWCLEAYGFDRYRKPSAPVALLHCPKGVDRSDVLRAAEAAWLTRDMVNTPASDLGPAEIERAAKAMARRFKARIAVVAGRALERGFPMIHHVGKASPRAPRLIDMVWGSRAAPKVTLVGKGVTFDTGGLDIKPASGMLLMKKDMGGAATVLGLAQMIMAARLPVRLRVLIPAVENSIAGNAFRPGDVLTSRKGLSVEIGNTDAEGRLILGDALALADEQAPDLLVDMATLTGAARVALGPDLPPFYTDDDAVAAAISQAATAENDPLWRMPFWDPYQRLFESGVADMNNSGDSGFAGSITAALFLRRFVEKAKAYVHFDIFAWTPQARPGRPRGAEAQGQRALFTMIRQRFGNELA